MGHQSHQEKRKTKRAAVKFPFQISHLDADMVTETHNISSAGAYCTVDRYISPNTKVAISLDIPESPTVETLQRTPTRINCNGIVVRNEPHIQKDGKMTYNIALFFIGLSDKERKRLNHYICEHNHNVVT